VGLNSLKYLWTARSPDELAKDVERIARPDMAAWQKTGLMVLGCSSGADILPFVPPRLSAGTLDRVDAVVLPAPSPTASFEFHVSDWLTTSARDTDRPVLPEVKTIIGPKLLCFYGSEEKAESLCPLVGPPAQVLRLDGGHHFGGDYRSIAEKTLAAIRIDSKAASDGH